MMVPEENTPQVWKFVIINIKLYFTRRDSQMHMIISPLFWTAFGRWIAIPDKKLCSERIAISTVSDSPLETLLPLANGELLWIGDSMIPQGFQRL